MLSSLFSEKCVPCGWLLLQKSVWIFPDESILIVRKTPSDFQNKKLINKLSQRQTIAWIFFQKKLIKTKGNLYDTCNIITRVKFLWFVWCTVKCLIVRKVKYYFTQVFGLRALMKVYVISDNDHTVWWSQINYSSIKLKLPPTLSVSFRQFRAICHLGFIWSKT